MGTEEASAAGDEDSFAVVFHFAILGWCLLVWCCLVSLLLSFDGVWIPAFVRMTGMYVRG